MNCVGKDNISYFLCMLLSLALLLTYGAYLAYAILSHELQEDATSHSREGIKNQHWSSGLTWSQYASMWSWALGIDFRIGGVGLLALLTAPIAWTMFLYHFYLIWAGTTTNESSKWSEWRELIERGLVFRWIGNTDGIPNAQADPIMEPYVKWPISSDQHLFWSEDGQRPDERSGPNRISADFSNLGTDPEMSSWKPVYGLYEIENLYDLGFWDNLKDAFGYV